MKTSRQRKDSTDRNNRNGSNQSHHLNTTALQELSRSEAELLRQYEELIGTGLETFFEVGSALLAIREDRLYRAHYTSFESYCRERWGFGRVYAWRIIGAAERLKLLSGDEATRKPTSEFQMRPFLKLEPEEFPGVWKQVLERAKGGKITSELIGGLIEEICGNARPKKNRLNQSKKIWFDRGTIGEIVVLLTEVKKHIEREQSDRAIAELERIERLLFQPR